MKLAPHALVTGAAGFVGSHVVDRLLREGWAVTAVDNFDATYDPAVKTRNVAAHARHPGYRLERLDVREEPALLTRLEPEPIDAIVHLAALVGGRSSVDRARAYQDVNVLGTQSLLEFARQRGVPHFVFASSGGVYGGCPNLPWRESEAVRGPLSPYAASKLSGELLGHVYAHLYGLRFVALRLFTVYGPRQRPDLAIHRFARRMLAGWPIPVFGDGHSRRDYAFVTDVVDGVLGALAYEGRLFEVINLGGGSPVRLSEMIATLEDVLGTRARLERLPEQAGDVPQTWADLSRARDLLGYAPHTPFAEGVTRLAAWLREERSPQVSGSPAP
ncbi:NAD-dependent epimerase/dehydratase family protein [Deinococcus aestuarii]|uniref:NAD-dependent epimerase/dehydratase family protein n=1 Tax=Deinococcus aestuarii TaxID=2774531 RepID=UPI001C0D7371